MLPGAIAFHASNYTMKKLRKHLQEQFDYLETMCREFALDPSNDLEAAEIVEEARRRCCEYGFEEIGEEATVLSPRSALPILGKLLTWARERKSKTDTLTVTEAAANARVGRRKVLAWINAGLLSAANTGNGSRPRYTINRVVWEGFLAGHTKAVKPPSTRRHKRRQPADVIEFFPAYTTPA